MVLSGKLLLYAMAFIIFHSVFCLSIVSSKECILVMWYRYAAVLCSLGVVGCIVDGCVCCGGFSVYVYLKVGTVPDY